MGEGGGCVDRYKEGGEGGSKRGKGCVGMTLLGREGRRVTEREGGGEKRVGG